MESVETQPVVIQPVKNEAELFQALAIREVVFIEEQHVPEGIERDAEDARAYHVLALQGGHAIGTGRLVVLPTPPPEESGKWAQVGRMAVRFEVLMPLQDPDQRLVIYRAVDQESQSALDRLCAE